MKSLPGTVRYIVVGVGLVTIATYLLAIGSERGVEVGRNAFVDAKGRTRDIYMIIRPEAKVSGTEADQVRQKLSMFDKSLYKIQTYENGKLVKTDGRLDDKIMQNGLATDVAHQAESIQFTGIALQVGRTFPPPPTPSPSTNVAAEHSPHPHPSPSVSPSPTVPPGPSTTMVWETRGKIKELEPLLSKYNKK